MKNTRFLAEAAVIAALYFVLTILFAPISYGVIQIRISEVLTILPIFTPAAIPGLFTGCLISNIFGGYGVLDIVFGSVATLIAAFLTGVFKKRPAAAMVFPVLVNAVIVGALLYVQISAQMPIYMYMLYVAAGEFVSCYFAGLPVYYALKRKIDKKVDGK